MISCSSCLKLPCVLLRIRAQQVLGVVLEQALIRVQRHIFVIHLELIIVSTSTFV
jgi:hypothetical protein